MKHHPDFYADDERPQFSTLSFEKQQEIICDWLSNDFKVAYDPNRIEYAVEAISQMKPDSTVSDLLLYIAKCISTHYPQEDFTI